MLVGVERCDVLERFLGDEGDVSGTVIAEAIYGANDGIVSTFAIVSGVTGAELVPSTILIIGVASLLADGYSMAVSNYLSRQTERRIQHSTEDGSTQSSSEQSGTSPLGTATVTFFAFVIAGTAPLIPYVLDLAPSFWWATASTGVAFFIIGGSRTFVTDRRWYIAGGQMLLIGMSAATVAYFVGGLMEGMG